MQLTLLRLPETHHATPGVLLIPDKGPALYTIERPWQMNRRRISCIPVGDYSLKRRNCGDDPTRETFYLKSWCVSDSPDEDTARWGIRFDVANYAHELMGCIALGTGVSTHTEQGIMVTGSADANEALLQRLMFPINSLSIRHA